MSFTFHCRDIMDWPKSSGKPLPIISMVMFCLSKLFLYSYNPSVPRQRVMKLTTMVLALVPIFILSAAPYHVMQLVNLTGGAALTGFLSEILPLHLSQLCQQ